MDKLPQLCPEIEPSLPSFLKLHKTLKRNVLNPDNVEWFVDLIEIGIIKLPELQGQYQSIQNNVLGIQ
jgi:hypothetical protein